MARPEEISGSHPSCTYPVDRARRNECDEDQFAIPAVAADGTVHVHFGNQNEARVGVGRRLRHPDHGGHLARRWRRPSALRSRSPSSRTAHRDMPFSVIGRQTVWGHQIRWSSDGNIAVDPTDPNHVTVVWSPTGGPPTRTRRRAASSKPRTAPDLRPVQRRAGQRPGRVPRRLVRRRRDLGPPGRCSTTAAARRSGSRGRLPSDGTLVVAWDEDTAPAPADDVRPRAVGRRGERGPVAREEQVDISVTHWSGQYVPQAAWPTVCGPAGYTDPPVTDAAGKDCNVFHGDYTGLAVGPDGSVHVVWTGLNRLATPRSSTCTPGARTTATPRTPCTPAGRDSP